MSAFAVTILTPPDYVHSAVFNEVADSIHHGLLALGHDSIRTTQVNIPNRQHIILGCNMRHWGNMPLADNAILYNLEQIDPDSPWCDPKIFEYYRRYTLWDYSIQNVEALNKLDIQVAKILPIGYVPALTRLDPTSPKDIDVLFIGSMNERRESVIRRMGDLGLNTAVGVAVYGEHRDKALARAKIILNVHHYEAKVLEMVRISYLLANRCTVLSEHSSNPDEDSEISDGVAFAHYDDLPQMALELIQNDARREELSQRGFELIRQRPIEKYLAAALA